MSESGRVGLQKTYKPIPRRREFQQRAKRTTSREYRQQKDSKGKRKKKKKKSRSGKDEDDRLEESINVLLDDQSLVCG